MSMTRMTNAINGAKDRDAANNYTQQTTH